MLKIVLRPEFTVTVNVNTAHTQGSFEMDCVALPSDELQRLEAEAVKLKRGSQGIMPDVVLRVRQIELPDNPQPTVAQVLNLPGLDTAMVTAYYRGLWEERRGNSAPPPAGS